MSGEVIKWAALLPDQRDALVHEKVMGHKERAICRSEQRYGYDDGDWECGECGATGQWNNAMVGDHYQPIPHYTQSLDAAWLVMEHFDELVLVVHVKPRWHCTLHKDEAPSGNATMKTPQEAICVAALRAAGITVDESEKTDG